MRPKLHHSVTPLPCALGTQGDDYLSPEELPAEFFDRLDADQDGFIPQEELKALRQR